MRRLYCWIALLMASSLVQASEPLPAGLTAIPHARLLASPEPGVAERFYPMSSLRRISNQPRAEQRLDVEGQLQAWTLQLPAGHSALTAFERARVELAAQAELLYWCEGRDCGASSLWANQVFGRAELSAPDEQQAFALLHLNAEPNTLVVLYAANRANRRAYLQIEQLQSSEALGQVLPTPATLLRQLRSEGALVLAQWPEQPTQPWLDLLKRTLRLDSTLRLELQGATAAAWVKALQDLGVRSSRLQAAESAQARLSLRRMP